MSAWRELEACLRRVNVLRWLQAPDERIASEIELARSLWVRVPPSPAGMTLVWPGELQALARELGFDPDTRDPGPRDPELERGVATAARRFDKAVAIQKAIEAAGGITDLKVLVAGPVITLTGSASDEAACDRAAAIAKQLAPDALGVDNRLVVRKQ